MKRVINLRVESVAYFKHFSEKSCKLMQNFVCAAKLLQQKAIYFNEIWRISFLLEMLSTAFCPRIVVKL